MKSTSSTVHAAHTVSTATKATYWVSTAFFCLMMAGSAIAYLTAPMMAQAFTHLGFPPYFRVELAIAKLIGVVVLLAPVPARFKEWAYAGFGITLISAFIAHSSVDGVPTAIGPVVALAVLVVSYSVRERLRQASPGTTGASSAASVAAGA